MSDTTTGIPRKRTTTTRSSRSTRSASAVAAEPTHDEIAARARQLFEASGHPGGRDLEFWLEAERQLREVRAR